MLVITSGYSHLFSDDFQQFQGLLPLLSPLAGADGAVVTWKVSWKFDTIWQLWLETQKKKMQIQQPFDGDLMVLARL